LFRNQFLGSRFFFHYTIIIEILNRSGSNIRKLYLADSNITGVGVEEGNTEPVRLSESDRWRTEGDS